MKDRLNFIKQVLWIFELQRLPNTRILIISQQFVDMLIEHRNILNIQ